MINEVMQAQKRFFADQVTYTADLTDLGYPSSANVDSAESRYQVTAVACAGGTVADCVIVRAVPQGVQAADGNLSLSRRGEKTGNWQEPQGS
jgi:type IV pilus assembly protein PilE